MTIYKTEDSLRKRYLTKLVSNVLGLLIALVIAAIVPRALGPKDYGDFSFLTNFFTQCLPLLTFSTSLGFYTLLSKRQNEFGLISFYWRINLLAFSLLFIFILLAQTTNITSILWPEQNINYILMASIFSIFVWLLNILTQIGDAKALTVSFEISKTIQKFIGLLLIIFLFWSEYLNLYVYYYYNYFNILLLIIAYLLILNRSGYSVISNWNLTKNQIKKYFHEFYAYSKPLFFYAFFGLIVGLFDRWALQKFGGSVQQGYFGLSLQIGTVCFLFTASMGILLNREFSIAHQNDNLTEIKRLFRRFIPPLYSISAFFGCFVAVEAKTIISIFGGSQYENAIIPMSIMAFYPIHQTYGQLSSSVFYASGQTRIYSDINIVCMILGFPLAYFTMAPESLLGFNLGATGLAIKFVVVQFIAVNVCLYYNSKYLKLNFLKYLAHQFVIVILLFSIALVAKYLANYMSLFLENDIFKFLISGILYCTFICITIFILPIAFGIYRRDINKIKTSLKNIINKK